MRVLVAGDSLGLPRPHRINSYSPDETDLAVSYEQTYSSIINRELLKYYKMNPYVEVINRSRRSQTIANVAEEFLDHLFFYEPDIIIMQVGLVDCWFREDNAIVLDGGDFADFKSILNILEVLKHRPACKLLIIGIAPTSEKMEKKYNGINQEIRLYNQVLKSVVDNKTIFYVDMEQYVKPEQSLKYLLPDGQHLNQEGNKLVAEKAIGLLKGFIYADLGVQQYNDGDVEEAIRYFEKSYDVAPLDLNNIYNMMVIYFGNQDNEKLEQLINYIRSNKFDDAEILNIIEVVQADRD